jgi:hypothetical protein
VYNGWTRLRAESRGVIELLGDEEVNNRGFLSRLVSTIYLVMYVLCCLSFDVSIVTPLNDSRVYSELSMKRGVTGNVTAE